MPRVLRSRKGLLGLGGIAAGTLFVAGFATWYFVFRDVATPVTVGEAVTSFRGDTGRTPGPSPVPVGVYVYATEGSEHTDALMGATHHYPPRSTITVTKDPCGVKMRWDALEGRSTTWTFCVDGGRWVMTTQDERHTFFGVTEATTYECSDVPFRTPGDRPGAPTAVTCTTSGAVEHVMQRVVGPETLRVGGENVPAVHVHQATSLSGDIRGASTYDIWLDRKTGVPVRIAMVSRSKNDSPVGDVHYDEMVTLRLRSLTPRR